MPQQPQFDLLVGDDRAKELVKSRYIAASKAQTKQLTNFDKWFRMYKNERVNANYKGLSNVVVPKVFEKVERGTAILSQAIKKIKVNPQGQEDVQGAQLNEKLIEYEDRVLNIPRIRKQWIRSGRIYGTSFLKCTWNVGKEEPDAPFKGIDISLPDPKTIFFNPDHTCEEPFRWAIHEVDVPFSEIKANKQFKKANLDEVKSTSTLGGRKLVNVGNRNQPLDTDETTLMVNVKEYYGPFAPNENADEKPYMIIVANDAVVLLSIPNPYAEIMEDPIPIFPLYIYPVPGEAYGMGDAEAIESLSTELNDTRNQRLDTVSLNIDPMKIILRGAQINESELVAKKGWVVHSNLPNGIQVIPPDMQGVVAAINEEKIIQGDIDRTLGIPSFGAQTPVTGDITTDTATGVNATLQAQDVISNSVLEEVKNSLQKFYRAILAYNQTFIDRGFKISLVSDLQPQALEINPQSIAGNVDLDIEVELVGNRIARRAEALQALQVGSKIPGTNMGKLWEEYLQTHDKYNIQEYYQPPQPTPPEPPKISVGLSGPLSELQAAQIYKTIPGVSPLYADPAFTEMGRQIMRGNLPEHQAAADKQFEQQIQTKQLETKNAAK